MAADRELVEKLIYGTAWKGDRTANLVYSALKSGFRAIATAAQPKHYREELVGDGIREAISDGIVKRNEIFVRDPLRFPDSCNVCHNLTVDTKDSNYLHALPKSGSSKPPL